MPAAVSSSALARVAIDLAARLDAEPADTSAVLLARELRMAMADLREQAKGDAGHEVEQFLARISTPSFGDAAH